jgi:hypothetical protein
MKRVLSLTLSLLLLTVLPISSSEALTIPGSKCSKVKATKTISGKKYTCIKSGKSLIWNKGVSVKKATSSIHGTCPPASAADKVEITQLRADALITMSEDMAQDCAMSLDWLYRVGERDGEYFAMTRDYNASRVTVSIKAGLIVSVQVG